MADFIFDTTKNTFSGHGRTVLCKSFVHNELNKLRPNPIKGTDVVYTITAEGKKGVPYMPRPFPKGLWKLTSVETHKSPEEKSEGYLYPYFVNTNACQQVEQWALTSDGHYDKPIGVSVTDYAYGFHWAEKSLTTLGCGRFALEESIEWLVGLIAEATLAKKTLTVEVI